MMEADIRRSDIKKAVYEFERDIVRGAINQVGLVFSYAHPELYFFFVEDKKDTGRESH